MRILITGGSGFIGTNLLDFYKKKGGYDLLNVDLLQPRNPDHKKLFAQCDITDYEKLTSIVTDFAPDVVFHLAARTDLAGRSIEDYSANTKGVENIVRVINELKTKPKISVFASSRLVCEIGYTPKSDFDYCPTTFYGESKVVGERIVRDNISPSLNWTIVRPTSIWGPWFGVPYRNFFDAVRAHRYIHPRGMVIPKSFGYIGNSVFQLNSMLDTNEVLDKLYYLCDFEPLDVAVWSRLIATEFSVAQPFSAPLSLLKIIGKSGDIFEALTSKSAPLTTFRLNNLTTPMVFDNSNLYRVSGSLPFSISDGVKATVDWIVKS